MSPDIAPVRSIVNLGIEILTSSALEISSDIVEFALDRPVCTATERGQLPI